MPLASGDAVCLQKENRDSTSRDAKITRVIILINVIIEMQLWNVELRSFFIE